MASSALACVRATPVMASSALACVRATPSMASSALACVRATPSIAASASAASRSTSSIAASARSTIFVDPVDSSPTTRPSSSSIRPIAAPTRGTRARASVTPSRTPPTAERTSDGPGSDGSLTRHTLRTATVGHYSVASVGRRSRGPPLPRVRRGDRRRPRIVGEGTDGARTTTRRCRHRWGNSRRGTARVAGIPGGSRGVPERTRRARDGEPSAAEPVTVEQLLARQGSAVGGRRRAARRVEEPRERVRRPASPSSPHPPSDRVCRPSPEPARGSAAGRTAARARSCRAARLRRPVCPPVPGRPARPAAWEPDSRPSRRSGPIPPLPGTVAPKTASPRTPRHPRARRAAPRAAPAGAGSSAPLMALGAVVGVVLLYHLGLYFYVDQKIDRVDALATDGPEVLAPALQAGARDLPRRRHAACPGQDRRGLGGHAARVGRRPTASRAVLVSFPPTALVDTPDCRTPDGSLREPGHRGVRRVAARGRARRAWCARSSSSPACASTTTSASTSPGCPGMVDALGGVPVCVVPSAATAAAAEPAARRGSPSSPVTRPPATCSRATAGPTSPGPPSPSGPSGCSPRPCARPCRRSTLADPVTLTRFLNRAADALTVDEQTTLGDLRALAGSLGDLSGDAVQRAGAAGRPGRLRARGHRPGLRPARRRRHPARSSTR